MSSKRPVKLGSSKSKKSGVDKAMAWAKKNTVGVGVCAAIVLCILFISLSPSKPEHLAIREENMKTTIVNADAMANRYRKAQRSYSDPAAAELWASFTPWQRQHTLSTVEEELKEDFKKNVAMLLNAPDLVSMFKTATPDVHMPEFTEDATRLGTLFPAWLAGTDLTVAAMTQDGLDSWAEVSKINFWGGLEDYSDADRLSLSLGGWSGARRAMLGRFFRSLHTMLAANVAAVADGQELDFPDEPEPEPEWKDEEDAQDVAHLEDDTFDAIVLSRTHALVMFYAPWCGHCKKMKPDYGRAASELIDYDVVIGAVDATHAKSRQLKKRFAVEGFPTLFAFKDGQEAGKFDGERTLHGILTFFNTPERLASPELEALAEEFKPPVVLAWKDEENVVTHLEDATFHSVVDASKHTLVMFYAPWCGHCKAFKPAYGEAAAHFKDNADIMIAALDATAHKKVGAEFEVKGYPTTLYFENGAMVEKYKSARDLDGVITYMEAKAGKAEL